MTDEELKIVSDMNVKTYLPLENEMIPTRNCGFVSLQDYNAMQSQYEACMAKTIAQIEARASRGEYGYTTMSAALDAAEEGDEITSRLFVIKKGGEV